ncbi:hypothetical protein ACHAXH_000049 [Discostella pseudostelligera]
MKERLHSFQHSNLTKAHQTMTHHINSAFLLGQIESYFAPIKFEFLNTNQLRRRGTVITDQCLGLSNLDGESKTKWLLEADQNERGEEKWRNGEGPGQIQEVVAGNGLISYSVQVSNNRYDISTPTSSLSD